MPHTYVLQSVSQFIESRWYCRQTTVTLYRHTLTPFALWLEGRAITYDTINQYLSSLKTRKLSDETIKNVFRMLKTFCRWLVSIDILASNPFSKLKAPPLKRRRRQVYSDEDIVKMLTHTAAPSWNIKRKTTRLQWKTGGPLERETVQCRALILLLCDSAMRASEVCSLTCGWIRKRELIIVGKGGHEDVVFISDLTRDILVELAGDRPDSAPLFRNRKGGQCTPASLRFIIGRIARRSGVALPPRPVHAFRHYAARKWLANDASTLTIKQLMRHSQLSTTEIYTALDAEDLSKIHARISPIHTLMKQAGLV